MNFGEMGNRKSVKRRDDEQVDIEEEMKKENRPHKAMGDGDWVLAIEFDDCKGESCVLCLLDFEEKEDVVKLSECDGHYFHKDCGLPMTIEEYINLENRCPYCKKIYGVVTGIMPDGSFTHYTDASSLPGYEDYGTIIMSFSFGSGIQGPEHPNTGKEYHGTSRTGYLPDCEEGRRVLELLQVAWERRLMFTVGQSITTGRDNCVIWNGIHIKTNRTGGYSHFGYPDATYLDRVTDEMKGKGIHL